MNPKATIVLAFRSCFQSPVSTQLSGFPANYFRGLVKLHRRGFARLKPATSTRKPTNKTQNELHQDERTERANDSPSIWKDNEEESELNESKDPDSDIKKLNNKIISDAKTLKELSAIYEEKGPSFNPVNYCTYLNQCLKIVSKSADRNYKSLNGRIDIEGCISELTANFEKLQPFTIANFLANLSKLDRMNKTLLEMISDLTVRGKIKFNETSTSYILWSMAQSKYKNTDYLKAVSKLLMGPKVMLPSLYLISVQMICSKIFKAEVSPTCSGHWRSLDTET
jgi:hypothetical protein